ncbi:MAG: DNA adenine methylase [Deltaproteobacteria bacterium]|nr:DNA adenine methylase [Deltaproteobacteria bacterium]
MPRSSPIPYYGGKFHLAPVLLRLMPVHEVYVEPFGGGGSFLFAKPRVEIEVYNDIDRTLFTLFRVLRDPEKFWKFYWSMCLTPYSRDEYRLSLEADKLAPDDPNLEIEIARRTYFDIRASIQARRGSGFSFPVTPGVGSINSPEVTQNAVAELPMIQKRLRSVIVENKDAIKLMEQYANTATLVYLDPPYVHDTRLARAKYRHEIDDEYHRKLIECCIKYPGMIMLSGYESPLYDPLIAAGWDKKHAKAFTTTAGRTAQANSTDDHTRTEVIWRNPNCLGHHMKRLFDIESHTEEVVKTVVTPDTSGDAEFDAIVDALTGNDEAAMDTLIESGENGKTDT